MSFEIIRNDITKVRADAIVNTANPRPIYAGGTDSAIYEAAGKERLLAERKKIGDIQRGDAAVTPAFNLPAKYIIHTVGPVWNGGAQGEFDILRSCYAKSLELALKLECRSIAFPLISTGVYGFPKDKALQIALSVIQPFIMEHPMDVILVVFNKQAFELSGKVVQNVREYVDSHYVEEASRREYEIDNHPSNLGYGNSFDLSELSYRIRERAERLGRGRIRREVETLSENLNMPAPRMSGEKDADVCGAPSRSAARMAGERKAGLGEEQSKSVAFKPEEEADLCEVQSKPMPRMAGEKDADLREEQSKSAVFMPEEEADLCGSSSKAMPRMSVKKEAVSGKVSIEDLLAASDKTFQEKLFEIIDERGLKDSEVYKNYVSKQVFSKIRTDREYHPNKYTAIALCLSLHLNIEETQDLIGRAGWALSPSSKADLVVKGCILNQEFNVVKINCILFDMNCSQLDKIK